MATLLRSVLTAAMIVAVALIGLVLARPAAATPRCGRDCATMWVNPARPAAGTVLTVVGGDFGRWDRVEFRLHGATNVLGSAHTDANGAFRTTVTLPSDLAGRRPIVALDAITKQQARQVLRIGASNVGGVGRGANGADRKRSAADARVAIIGLAALGVVLLTGGGLLLRTRRRERFSF